MWFQEPVRYVNPWWIPGGHLQTLGPAVFGSRRDPGYLRQRLELPDGDFVDIDWLLNGSPDLVVLVHGLEGSSRSPYMVSMARALDRASPKRDVLALNLRSCSGEPNRTRRFYHSGETGDLQIVLDNVPPGYRSIALVGFSLGGNIVMKYLGEFPDRVSARVSGAMAISVPCHLSSSARVLARPVNRIYMHRFMQTLAAKIRHHAEHHPGAIDLTGIRRMRTFSEFDGRFTGPLHGFRDADDYWSKSSSLQFLPRIGIPTLLVNARNDPFLSEECFPEPGAIGNALLTLEYPASGGHIGFPGRGSGSFGWKENRAIQFLNTQAVQRTTPM